MRRFLGLVGIASLLLAACGQQDLGGRGQVRGKADGDDFFGATPIEKLGNKENGVPGTWALPADSSWLRAPQQGFRVAVTGATPQVRLVIHRQTITSCGGLAGIPCPEDQHCVAAAAGSGHDSFTTCTKTHEPEVVLWNTRQEGPEIYFASQQADERTLHYRVAATGPSLSSYDLVRFELQNHSASVSLPRCQLESGQRLPGCDDPTDLLLLPPLARGPQVLSTTCAMDDGTPCDLSTHDCVGGTDKVGSSWKYTCQPKLFSLQGEQLCNYAAGINPGYYFRQCSCSGAQWCGKADGLPGRWSGACSTENEDFGCVPQTPQVDVAFAVEHGQIEARLVNRGSQPVFVRECTGLYWRAATGQGALPAWRCTQAPFNQRVIRIAPGATWDAPPMSLPTQPGQWVLAADLQLDCVQVGNLPIFECGEATPMMVQARSPVDVSCSDVAGRYAGSILAAKKCSRWDHDAAGPEIYGSCDKQVSTRLDCPRCKTFVNPESEHAERLDQLAEGFRAAGCPVQPSCNEACGYDAGFPVAPELACTAQGMSQYYCDIPPGSSN